MLERRIEELQGQLIEMNKLKKKIKEQEKEIEGYKTSHDKLYGQFKEIEEENEKLKIFKKEHQEDTEKLYHLMNY